VPSPMILIDLQRHFRHYKRFHSLYLNKKLSCRRETARRFLSLTILLS